MKLPNLPSKEAKSLSFLAYSLACLILSNVTSDTLTKYVFLSFAAISFLLAAVKFIRDSLKFPLVPCKNRVEGSDGLICARDKGFFLGCLISFVALAFYKFFHFDFPVNKTVSIIIAILCTLPTIIHGTLRRYIGVFIDKNKTNKIITFIVGVATGLAIFFVSIFFI